MDLGRANGRYFANVFSCGLFTDVSQKTPTAWKNNLGKIAYYINGIGDLPRFRKMELSITSDGGDFRGNAIIFFVFNGRTAGTLPLAYLSEGDDGLLDILVLKAIRRSTPCTQPSDTCPDCCTAGAIRKASSTSGAAGCMRSATGTNIRM